MNLIGGLGITASRGRRTSGHGEDDSRNQKTQRARKKSKQDGERSERQKVRRSRQVRKFVLFALFGFLPAFSPKVASHSRLSIFVNSPNIHFSSTKWYLLHNYFP